MPEAARRIDSTMVLDTTVGWAADVEVDLAMANTIADPDGAQSFTGSELQRQPLPRPGHHSVVAPQPVQITMKSL